MEGFTDGPKRRTLQSKPDRIDKILGYTKSRPAKDFNSSLASRSQGNQERQNISSQSELIFQRDSQMSISESQEYFSCSQGPYSFSQNHGQSQEQTWGSQISNDHLNSNNSAFNSYNDILSQNSASCASRSFEASLAAKSHNEVMKSLSAIQASQESSMSLLQASESRSTDIIQSMEERTHELIRDIGSNLDSKMNEALKRISDDVCRTVSEAVSSSMSSEINRLQKQISLLIDSHVEAEARFTRGHISSPVIEPSADVACKQNTKLANLHNIAESNLESLEFNPVNSYSHAYRSHSVEASQCGSKATRKTSICQYDAQKCTARYIDSEIDSDDSGSQGISIDEYLNKRSGISSALNYRNKRIKLSLQVRTNCRKRHSFGDSSESFAY